MKNIAIIGITGSIGKSAVQVVKNHPQQFTVKLATSHNKKEELATLKNELNIEKAILTNKSKEDDSSLIYGQDKLFQLLAENQYDIVINAVSGSAGLIYSHHILKNNHTLALANKESLVMAGHIFTKMTNRIIPIDSEHSALLQVMSGVKASEIRKLILTASGGPFLTKPIESFDSITPQEALQHPTWSMGSKITIDSATMFNKALEIIEAHWLFGFDYDKIEAVIHPQSIIHSCIECSDGSIISQMSNPSMELPILYALSYPNRIDSNLTKTSLLQLPSLTFLPIEKERYPLFFLTLEAAKAGGLMPTVINAANEAAIKLFFEGKITFPQIYQLIADYIQDINNISSPNLETVIETNSYVFNEVYNSF